MKITILIPFFVCLFFNSYSQSENYLLGKVYTKSTGMGSSSDLSFNNRTTGVMEGVSDFNGKEYIVSTGFSYTINGNSLQIIYQKGLGTEDYTIDRSSDQIVSTHLQGYVDGKWSKVIFKRKQGAGTPGQVEGANYSWNKVPDAKDNMVRIGKQIWMTKNLNVDTFQNGDKIKEASNSTEWEQCILNKVPAWCYYDNNPSNSEKYGKLYNWFAVSDSRKLAPKGWRIPSSEDWDELTVKNLGDNGSIYGKPGYFMKNRNGWAQSNSVSGDFGNTSGFSALPGGYRQRNGVYLYETYWALFWMFSKDKNTDEWNRLLSYDSDKASTLTKLGQDAGLSVRCIASNGDEINGDAIIKIYKLNDELDGGKIAYLDPSGKHGLIWTKTIYGEKQTVWNYNVSKNVCKLDNQTITYDYASQYCNRIGSGWRLPTLDEAKKIYENRTSIGLMWLTPNGYKTLDESVWVSDIENWNSDGRNVSINVVFYLTNGTKILIPQNSAYGNEFRFFAVKSF
jgi:uncharacterized protein (TIGR02145 family)